MYCCFVFLKILIDSSKDFLLNYIKRVSENLKETPDIRVFLFQLKIIFNHCVYLIFFACKLSIILKPIYIERWKARLCGSVPMGKGAHACVNAACR